MDEAAERILFNMISRRSVRSYQERQIRDEDLGAILRCGLFAPSGGNSQYSRFIVLQDAGGLHALNHLIQANLASREIVEGQWMNRGIRRARRADYHFIYHAPTLISAVAPRTYENGMADCACALQNMQLAAWALGLGACWSNQPHWLTGDPEIRAFFRQYGLREDEDIFGSISVGYATARPDRIPARKEGRVVLDLPRELGLSEEC